MWSAAAAEYWLMTQYDELRFQLPSRPEAVTQHAEDQEPDCNQLAIMF
jgi:hypothetical protein